MTSLMEKQSQALEALSHELAMNKETISRLQGIAENNKANHGNFPIYSSHKDRPGPEPALARQKHKFRHYE